jgi:hypothetical protein
MCTSTIIPSQVIIVRNEGQTYEGLKKQLGGAQGRGQGAGQETGRAQQDGDLLGDGCESFLDSRTNVPSN